MKLSSATKNPGLPTDADYEPSKNNKCSDRNDDMPGNDNREINETNKTTSQVIK